MPTANVLNGVNLASKYATKVDERFTKSSQVEMALNHDYSFQGVRTVNVYSIPTVPLKNYTRSGVNRYGTPTDLPNNVQELTVTRDRAFNFVIDRADKNQTQMTQDAGKALSREISEVVIPEFDTYVFWTWAKKAVANGQTATGSLTKSNAYEAFLNAQEVLGNKNVPDRGRVCFCSYKFANLMKQDPAFMRYGDKSQNMLIKGVIGEIDGTRIVKVPASRLPTGANFILTHPVASCAPKQLNEHKIHDNPPGISGWLVEGRILYDCFVLDSKKDAIYYHGTAPAATFPLDAASSSGSGTESGGSGDGSGG